MTDDEMKIAELEDVEEKAYIFGLNLQDEREASNLQNSLDQLFENAGVMLVNLPIDEGSNIEIHETSKEELNELLDYREVMGDIDD